MFDAVPRIGSAESLRLLGMDPRFLVTREELYNFQMDIKQVQHVQSSHAERISRLEKRQADDAALKSVWNSPFPGVLGGTPQHGPLQMPSHEMFDDLDEQGEHLLGSLHLGPAEEEPTRRGAASRANSVRFDESALQGSGWSHHNGRQSGEFAPMRSSSTGNGGGNGGLLMERSLSYKSDGRHSSAGHSVHSVHSHYSGRASSLGLDTTSFGGAPGDDSPVDYIEPPPGFFVLGSVPSIVRCWLTADFGPETLLYAAVCTGAQKSTVAYSQVKALALTDETYRDVDGIYRIRLPVYLAEAMPRPPSTNSTIPSIMASFEVVGVDQPETAGETKSNICVFLGSDTLRAHSADILFSQNQMSIFSTERSKFAVPFARPEDSNIFRHLCTSSIAPEKTRLNANAVPFVSSELSKAQPDTMRSSHVSDEGAGDTDEMGHMNGNGHMDDATSTSGTGDHDHANEPGSRSPLSPTQRSPKRTGPTVTVLGNGSEDGGGSGGGGSGAVRPAQQDQDQDTSGTDTGSRDSGGDLSGMSTESRRESATGIWGSWRNGASGGGSGGGGGDNGQREVGPLSGYQPAGRRNMKVLRPQKSAGIKYEAAPSLFSSLSTRPAGGESRRRSHAGTSGALDRGDSFFRAGRRDSTNNNRRSVVANGERTPVSMTPTPAPAPAPVTAASTPMATATTPRESRGSTQVRLAATSTNPVGVASAFSWMNSDAKTPTTTAE